MFYVVNKKNSEGKDQIAICKAQGCDDVNRMLGGDPDYSKWVCFSEEQVTTLLHTKEGYLLENT